MSQKPLTCLICGQPEFDLVDGFYFCQECGTQSQQVRDLDVQCEYDDHTYRKRLKFKAASNNNLELTSWESFNYLLRGLVEEVINLGANEGIKIVALQLWSAYLRNMEVAFFDKQRSTLPRLGTKYCPRDAKLLYNHERKRRRSVSSINSTTKGFWKRQKRRLAESEYEAYSTALLSQSSTSFSQLSSTSASTRSIQLQFNRIARKKLKKHMKKSHLGKHAADDQSSMQCHDLNKIRDTKKESKGQLNRKTIYTILYLALNMTGSDIQLSDMLRYMREGHLSTDKIAHFFPENVAENCEKIIFSKIGKSRRMVFLDSVIREHGADICKLINVSQLKIPDMGKLVQRYVTDLNLPKNLTVYLQRLISLCPAEMKLNIASRRLPSYEGRAIAYVIFALKLLFGLDDNKEKHISNAARKINQKLNTLGAPPESRLFSFTEWRSYIEMRKMIIAQCHTSTRANLKFDIFVPNLTDCWINDEQLLQDEELNTKVKVNPKFLILQKIFEKLHEHQKQKINSNNCSPMHFDFPPSLTPNELYLEQILANPKISICIPDYMREDHSVYDINSFIKPTRIKNVLKDYKIGLNVVIQKCDPNQVRVGIFRNYTNVERKEKFRTTFQKPNFNIDEKDWLASICDKKDHPGVGFSGDPKNENNKISLADKLRLFAEENCIDLTGSTNNKLTPERQSFLKRNKSLLTRTSDEPEESAGKLNAQVSSAKVFSDVNMTPLEEHLLNEPRRHLENDKPFDDLSDEMASNSEEDEVLEKQMEFVISAFDYWSLLGEIDELRFEQFEELKKQFPKNFTWLLETCSHITDVDCKQIYRELLLVENYFINVFDPIKNCKRIKYYNALKPFSFVIRKFNEFY